MKYKDTKKLMIECNIYDIIISCDEVRNKD